MKGTCADRLVVDTRRNAAALTRNPSVAVVVSVRGQTVLSGELRRKGSSHCRIGPVVGVVRKEDGIETLLIIWSALVQPCRFLSVGRASVIERHAESCEVRHEHGVRSLPIV